MKISRFVPIAAALALAVSCEKPQSQADRDAEVERKVQERLAAERQQQDLANKAAELDAREKALAAKESTDVDERAGTSAKPAATPRTTPRVATASKASSSSNKAPQGYETFYRKLEPHGAWRETGDYGYVWQPRKAQQSRQWRPYTDGRWAYTDAGWTWVSDEPFGWATYHYGRWTRLSGVGWVWVPGDEWAPAWVSWRTSDDHVGWAPLPPEARFERNKGIKKWADSYYDIDADEYVFIPNEYIGDDHLERHALPAERNVTIVQQTTNVTNITYSNTVVVNEGPNYDELRGRSRQPVPRLRLQREFDLEETEAPRARVQGDTLALIAPFFAARAAERPRTEGTPIRQTTVERNWASGGNRAEADRARAKMRAEATPPPDAPSKQYDKPVVAETAAAPAASSPAATAAPAATATAAATVQPTATPTATAGTTPAAASLTPSVRESPTATPVVTPSPTPTPRPTATPTATAVATPTPTATATPTPRATATPTPTPTPTATPTPRATASPTPTPTPTPTPRPTATATVAPTVTATAAPIATATPLPTSTPAAIATPRATAPPLATAAPVASPTPETDETPDPAESAAGRGLPGSDPRQDRARVRGEEGRQELDRRKRNVPGAAEGVTPAPVPIAPARGVTPPPTATPPPTSAAATPTSETADDPTSSIARQTSTVPPAQQRPRVGRGEELDSSAASPAPADPAASPGRDPRRERGRRAQEAGEASPSPSPGSTPERANEP